MSDLTGPSPSPPPPGNPNGGRRIGPYLLRHIIGEGGFGIVWLAERIDDFQKLVAIKMIKPGMGSDEVLARFEHERQALALMAHPNVAAVLDGGASGPDFGDRPYFVMEYVPGAPITDYCDDRKLTIRERLELFIQVCDGVQHAHSKGIIHRDLTPRNILIVEHDGKPVPKIIDFGISKALGRPLTDKFIFTHDGRMLGVPEYISPEQAQGLDIDTRADVYSLGVLLYELLTGAPPFDRSQLFSKGWEGMLRFIREAERPRPSTRLSSMGEVACTVAERRRLKPLTLRRELARDLEWIPLRALEAERNRRYVTPSALATDIQRYLDGDYDPPFGGRPLDSVRRFVRRNRRLLTVTGIIFIALGVWLATSLYQLEQKRIAEAEARSQAASARAAESLASRNAYEANIAAAASMIAADNVAPALDRLNLCPEDRRDWTWNWLRGSIPATAIDINEPPYCVRFSPDEQAIIVAGRYSVRVLDRAGAALPDRPPWKFYKNIPGFLDTDAVAAVSADGDRVLHCDTPQNTAADLVTTRVTLCQRSRDPRILHHQVLCRQGSPRTTLAAMSADGRTIMLCTREDERPSLRLLIDDLPDIHTPLDGRPLALALSRDGHWAATLLGTPRQDLLIIKVFDASGAVAWQAPVNFDHVNPDVAPLIALSDDGRTAIVSDGDSVRAIDAQAGVIIAPSVTEQPSRALALTPDAAKVLSGEGVVLHYAETRTSHAARLLGQSFNIVALDITRDGLAAVSCDARQTLCLWKLTPNLFSTGVSSLAQSAATPGLTAFLASAAPRGNSTDPVRLCAPDSTAAWKSSPIDLHISDPRTRIALSPDAHAFAEFTTDHLTILDLTPLSAPSRYELAALLADRAARPQALVRFLPGASGKRVLVAVFGGKGAACELAIAEPGATVLRPLDPLPLPPDAHVYASAPHPDLFALNTYGRILLFSRDASKPEVYEEQNIWPGPCAFDPPGQRLAVISHNHRLALYQPLQRRTLDSANGPRTTATCVDWISPTLIVTGHDDGAIAIWATDPLRVIIVHPIGAPARGTRSPVHALGFDAATQTLRVLTDDGILHVLDGAKR